MKKIMWITFVLVITTLAFVYLWNDVQQYKRIYPLTTFLSINAYVYFLSSISMMSAYATKIFKVSILLCLTVLVGNLLTYQVIKPNYTYVDAVQIIEKEEDVSVSEEAQKSYVIHENEHKQNYLIRALKDKEIVYFAFDPYSKEYFSVIF